MANFYVKFSLNVNGSAADLQTLKQSIDLLDQHGDYLNDFDPDDQADFDCAMLHIAAEAPDVPQDAIRALWDIARSAGGGLNAQAEIEKSAEGVDRLWIKAEENGNPEGLACLLQGWLAETKSGESISLLWSETCSKMRPDGFGGGAFFITADGLESTSAYQWAARHRLAHDNPDAVSRDAAARILNVQMAQGWGNETLEMLGREFIQKKGLSSAFAAALEARAAEENEMSADPEDDIM